ncbi:MAG: anti-sigma factor family protein [Candidatus Fervidibacter sp.]|uniref:anti-sigma factor family protein n=1 Tax=Candidatus Fervidibacter sp. TaxID=3100871 RepID=UPI004049C336
MRCKKVQSLLDTFADNRLAAKDEQRVAEHLQTCPSCQRQWEQVRKLKAWLDDAFSEFRPEPSPFLQQRLERALTTIRSTSPRHGTALRGAAKVAVIFSVIASLVFISSLLVRFSILTSSLQKPHSARVVAQGTSSFKGKQPKFGQQVTSHLRPQFNPTPKSTQGFVQRNLALRRQSSVAAVNSNLKIGRSHKPRKRTLLVRRQAKFYVKLPLTHETESPETTSTLPKEVIVFRVVHFVSSNLPQTELSAWAYQVVSVPRGIEVSSVIPTGSATGAVVFVNLPISAVPE